MSVCMEAYVGLYMSYDTSESLDIKNFIGLFAHLQRIQVKFV